MEITRAHCELGSWHTSDRFGVADAVDYEHTVVAGSRFKDSCYLYFQRNALCDCQQSKLTSKRACAHVDLNHNLFG